MSEVLPGLHEYGDNAIMLVASHLLRLLFLDQPEVEVLLARLRLRIGVLVQLHLLVQLLSVDLGDVLHHHCDVLGVKRALGDRNST